MISNRDCSFCGGVGSIPAFRFVARAATAGYIACAVDLLSSLSASSAVHDLKRGYELFCFCKSVRDEASSISAEREGALFPSQQLEAMETAGAKVAAVQDQVLRIELAVLHRARRDAKRRVVDRGRYDAKRRGDFAKRELDELGISEVDFG